MQPILYARLLLCAGAQLRRDALPRLTIGSQGGFELGPALADGREDRLQVFADPGDHRAERLVPGDAGPQTLDLLRALGAIALDALDASPLGPQLRVDLSPAAGGRAFIRGGPAALNRGNESARLLGGLVALNRRRPMRRDRGFTGAVEPARLGDRGLDLHAGRLLGLDRRLAGGDQHVTTVALGEHPLLADCGCLSQLARGGREHPSRMGDRDAVEVVGNLIEAVDHPDVPQQPAREHGRLVIAGDLVGQPLGPGHRRNRWRRVGLRARIEAPASPRPPAITTLPPSRLARSSSAAACSRSLARAAPSLPSSAAATASSYPAETVSASASERAPPGAD